MIIISIDPSLISSGYSIYNSDSEQIITKGTVPNPKSFSTLRKLENIESIFTCIFLQFKPDLLIIENTPSGFSGTTRQTLEILSSVNWIIRLAAYKQDIEIIGVFPISWKSFVKKNYNNNVKLAKLDIIPIANSYFKTNLSKKEIDIADSLGLLIFHLEKKL